MSNHKMHLNYPTFKSATKWLIGFVILVFCALMLAFGISNRIPTWANEVWWMACALYVFVGSLYLILRHLIQSPKQGNRQSFGQIALFPESWRRWILDTPEEKSKL